jgi:pimeloyl-ACP methyl ester carboxylesterase
MLHGISQQAHSWDFISLPLSVDYRVIALDQRGHGDSDWSPNGNYSTDIYVGDIEAFVGAMRLENFHLMGHSMGGRNSLAWASGRPGILKSLTIVDTGPETQRRGQNRIQQFRELPDELDTLDEFASRVMEYTGRNREQTMGALKYSIRQRQDGKWTWKYDKAMRVSGFRAPTWTPEQLWDGWRKIDCPALVVRGARSDIFADETMVRMAEEHPDCTTVTVENAGHLVQGDNPPDFLAAVRGLLSRFE